MCTLIKLKEFIQQSGQSGSIKWDSRKWQYMLKLEFGDKGYEVIKHESSWVVIESVRPRGNYRNFCKAILEIVGINLAKKWIYSTSPDQNEMALDWFFDKHNIDKYLDQYDFDISLKQTCLANVWSESGWIDTKTDSFWLSINEDTKSDYFIKKSFLEALENTKLFYPCSGFDLLAPVRMFAPYVTDFYFVDCGYFSPGHCNTRFYGYDQSADRQPPVFSQDIDFQYINRIITGPTVWDSSNRDIEPCLLSEYYQFRTSEKNITLHRRRGYGVYAFKNVKEINPLGVFFYRGDSMGEGGSGNIWLTERRINEICNMLIDGGLIVTDGSQHSADTQYQQLWQYHGENIPNIYAAQNIVKSSKPFIDKAGHLFTCVGYAGRFDSPSFIWQITK